ncbi:MAG: helix-hairpin-helix domain-containing protein, partial [Verrucomicrobia bacterium]|nr:helix-hairpin-helix domain-containing protein [Verrucomicrobiota bacterium]
MKPKPTRNTQHATRGFVLIMVLVVIMLSTMVAASLLFVLSAEQTASAASQSGEQAWATAMSGVYQAIRIAADPATEQADWQENPTAFRDQLVSDDGVQKWYFSVYSLPEASGEGVRYGLTDEASRVNVYNATAAMLEALPNLTPQLAQGLLYVRPGTGSSSTVITNRDPATGLLTMTDPGNPRWTCLDELLEVSGFSPALIYGSYSNLIIRTSNQTNAAGAPGSTESSAVPADAGLNQFLTVCSYDLNQDNQGQPRVNLDALDADLTGLGLPQGTLAYLQALGTNGIQLTNTVDLLWATNTFKDATGKEVILSSDITPAELPLLLDRCTTTNETRLVGLINLNTASPKALAVLPGMSEALAESIVAARVGLSAEARKTTAWLVQEGIVNADVFRQIAPYLTTRSYQFHFFAAAYCVPSANFRVIEAVVDVGAQPPVVLLL